MRLLPVFIIILFASCLILTPVTFATRRQVLGESTTTLSIPPTIEGPGLLLPDSPLYFLDQLKQQVRLFFAFTSEEKATIHAQIAGERMAELRFMLVKNNATATRTALQGVSDNLKNASSDVAAAQFSGRDVTKLAKDINDSIKAKQETLDNLELQAVGETKANVSAANESLLTAKIRVEDSLNPADLDNEIHYDLERQAQREVARADGTMKQLEMDLSFLSEEATKAAASSLTKREEALQVAISQKNDELRREQEKQLAVEKTNQLKVLDLQKQEIDQAKTAVAAAQTAAAKYRAAVQKTEDARANVTISSAK